MVFNEEPLKLLKSLRDMVRWRSSGDDEDGGTLNQLKLKDKGDGITIINTGCYQDMGGNSGPASCKEKVKMIYIMEGGKGRPCDVIDVGFNL